tara:strand:+ start:164 stop:343 length:180 start_codon:yes stop_codon:yes gene_type:complete
MTMKPESIDTVAATGGGATAIWNFVLGGNLNIILGAVVAILSIVVLVQRYRINQKELKK